jgi:methylated-DNA-protein-cysteine methyltransferase-like protein
MKDKSPLFQRTIALVKAIPPGFVLSYGQVAQLISAPGSARYVSYILSSSSKKYKLPWHRVLSSSGKIASHAHCLIQAQKLKKEGIEIVNNKVDLTVCTWRPNKKLVTSLLKDLPLHER